MLRFFRRQRPVHESEFQELRDNFELSTVGFLSLYIHILLLLIYLAHNSWSSTKRASIGGR